MAERDCGVSALSAPDDAIAQRALDRRLADWEARHPRPYARTSYDAIRSRQAARAEFRRSLLALMLTCGCVAVVGVLALVLGS